MELIIKSRTELSFKGTPFIYRFYRPGKEYILLDVGGNKRSQICHGGNYSGETIRYSGNDINEFKKICRRWYRNHMRNQWVILQPARKTQSSKS